MLGWRQLRWDNRWAVGFEVVGFATGLSVLRGQLAVLFEGHAPKALSTAVLSSIAVTVWSSSPSRVLAERGPAILRSAPRGVPAVMWAISHVERVRRNDRLGLRRPAVVWTTSRPFVGMNRSVADAWVTARAPRRLAGHRLLQHHQEPMNLEKWWPDIISRRTARSHPAHAIVSPCPGSSPCPLGESSGGLRPGSDASASHPLKVGTRLRNRRLRSHSVGNRVAVRFIRGTFESRCLTP